MSREFKRLEFTNIKAESEGRIRVGIAAVHGNVDSWNDRSHLGSFSKTIAEGMKRVRHLWNHNSQNPPIASIIKLEEVGRDALPAEVLAKSPEATGGLKVWREYYPKEINPISEIILYGIDKGDINEMSYAYDVVKADYTEEEIGGQKTQIRELREMRLYDTSDVNYGMNAATVAAGAKGFNMELLPLGNLYQQFLMHLEEYKAGRRNSSSDLALLNQMHENIVLLGAECAKTDDDEKQGNAPEKKEAEAAEQGTSLNSDWELRKRKLSILEL